MPLGLPEAKQGQFDVYLAALAIGHAGPRERFARLDARRVGVAAAGPGSPF